MKTKSEVNIVLVDDEPFMLKLHTRTLARLGYTSVTACEGGRAGLATLDAAVTFPDLILLDLNMPDIDGVEFIRHLVARAYPGSLLLVSGEDERMLQATQRLVHAHRIDSLGYLHKPVTAEQLAACLDRWKPASLAGTASATRSYGAEELRRAMTAGRLLNYYQPKVSLLTGQVVGVESLVRWDHAGDGLVMPDRFIGVAEKHGLIQELTLSILACALADTRRWELETGLRLQVSINVSMHDLEAPSFVDHVALRALQAELPPDRVILEITESRLTEDLRAPLEALTRLRLKRFRTSLDDFGTGHSPLAQLRDMPFDELKIDPGFVHRAWSDPKAGAIFDTSVTLGKQLGMTIVAEGVEDHADWDYVRHARCDAAQGFFIAEPMPADRLAGWIEDWKDRVSRFSSK